MKINYRLFSLIFIMFFISACKSSNLNTETTSELHIVTSLGQGADETSVFAKINRSFNEAYPHLTIVDGSQTVTEEWKRDVINSFETGSEPDVLFFFTDASAAEIISEDKVVPISEIKSKYPEYGEFIKEDVLSALVAADGNNYALPLTGYYEGLFCNVDLFEEFDLELPTTWEKFIKAIEVFNENDIIPISVSLDDVPHYWIEHLILAQAGVDDYMLNPKDSVPASWVDGLEYFKILKDMGAFPPDDLLENDWEANLLFQGKQAAMRLDGSWYANGLSDKDNTTIIPFPSLPNGKKRTDDLVGGFSSGFYITRKAWENTAKREMAVNFVMMHTTSSSIARYWWGAGMPASNSIAPVGLQRLLIDGSNISSAAIESHGMNAAIDSRIKPEAFAELISNSSNIANGTKTAREVMERVVALNTD